MMTTEELKKAIASQSAGNFGALSVLIQLTQLGRIEDALFTLSRREIRGPGIWILYKDRCGEDILRLADLLDHPPANLVAMSEDRP